jgi:hypothetical protein
MRHRGRTRAAALAVLALLTGCGDPELLDPTEEPLAGDRERIVARVTEGMTVAADQLGAGGPLGTRVDTRCSAGTDDWKTHDTHRSTCDVSISMGFVLDAAPAEALGGVDGLELFEERMLAVGWGGADWFLAGNPWGTGVTPDHLRTYGRPASDVIGVRLWDHSGDSGAHLDLAFRSATEPVEPPSRPLDDVEHSPVGLYHGDTEGSGWQDAWATERAAHPFALVGRGDAVLAEQSW